MGLNNGSAKPNIIEYISHLNTEMANKEVRMINRFLKLNEE